MHHRNMGDRMILAQQPRNMHRVGLFVIRLPIEHKTQAGMPRNIRHAQAIRAVGANQQLIPTSNNAGQHGLDAKGAAALHKHRRVFRFGHMRQRQQACADTLCDRLIVVIPSAMVKQHFLLDRIGRRQRPGCEQLIIMVHIYSPLV